jgi:transcriptional regulator PpsR
MGTESTFPADAIKLLQASADITLKLDPQGVIEQVQVTRKELALGDTGQWVGRRWEDIVTHESRPKVRELLQGTSRALWRHINFPTNQAEDAPFEIALVRAQESGSLIALGRDLSALAALQQRLVDAQQSLERDYLRLRHLETRYRALFQSINDAVLMVDAASEDVVEANPAALALLDRPPKLVIGAPFHQCFQTGASTRLDQAMAAVRASGKPELVDLAAVRGEAVQCHISIFRQEERWFFLMRLGGSRSNVEGQENEQQAKLLDLMQRSPDGFVITDETGRVQQCNAAFADMVQLQSQQALRGESLERWLGRAGVDMNVLLANLRQHGIVRLFSTSLRSEYGSNVPVEISAVRLQLPAPGSMGFTVRDIGRRLEREPQKSRELPRSASQLTELVGRVPLRDIVSETTDLIEQLCIEAALELTRDNRASAAEMLGLSRQSLYVKLRRYGLGDLGGEPDA